MQRSTRGSHVARSSSNDLYSILDLILDKGLVADVGLLKEEGSIDQARSEANVVFSGTAEDLRRADKVLNAASPRDGDRRQLDIAHYVLDVQVYQPSKPPRFGSRRDLASELPASASRESRSHSTGASTGAQPALEAVDPA